MNKTNKVVALFCAIVTTIAVSVCAAFSFQKVNAEGSDSYITSNSSTFTDGDTVVLTHTRNGTVYALNNDSGTVKPVAVTVSGDKLSTVPTPSLLWLVQVSSSGVSFQSLSDSKYLNAASPVKTTQTLASSSIFKNDTKLCSKTGNYLSYNTTGYAVTTASSRGLTFSYYSKTASGYAVNFYDGEELLHVATVSGTVSLSELQPPIPQTHGKAFSCWTLDGEKVEELTPTGEVNLYAAYTEGYLFRASVSTKGDVSLCFYMQFSDQDATVVFSIASRTLVIPVSEGERVTVEGEECVKFVCPVAAKEYDQPVSVSVETDLGDGSHYTYSVKQYTDGLLQTEGEEYATARVLAQKLASYCEAAKRYFSGNPVLAVDGVSTADLLPYAPVLSGEDSSVTLLGANLFLESETAINIYFTASEKVTVKVNGAERSYEQKEGYCVLTLGKVAAKDLDALFTVEIGGLQFTFGALSYAYNVLLDGTDARLCELVKALYAYNLAANAYFGG